MKILYLANVPAPYMVSYFNELGKLCDLTVLFEKTTSSERDKSWELYHFTNFKGIILNGISTAPDAAFCPGIIRYLKKNEYDFIISYTMATPTGILAIEYMKLMRIPYFLESEGGFAKSGKGMKESVKKQIMSGACGYFSTTPVADLYFTTYGADPSLIYKYPFTSISQSDIISEVPSPELKSDLRAELGITGNRCILAVGQFIHRKGFDILLKAACTLDSSVSICFVGGIPTDEYLSFVQDNHLDNIQFVGFKNKDDLRKYYLAADLFVLPTREDIWGLVINEAMACGLPIVTTDKCIAGLELVNETNGRIIPADNVSALSEALTELMSPMTDLRSLGEESLKRIGWYTFENMAAAHMSVFQRFPDKACSE